MAKYKINRSNTGCFLRWKALRYKKSQGFPSQQGTIVKMSNSVKYVSLVENTRTVDEYLASLDTQRVCYPNIPLPLPVTAEAACFLSDTSFGTLVIHLTFEIHQILYKHGIHAFTSIAPSIQSRLKGPKQEVVTVTITEQNEKAGWLEAAKDIHHLFEANGKPNTQIEMVNPQLVYYKEITSEPISVEDREFFESIRVSIYDILFRLTPDVWVDMGLFRCKFSSSTSTSLYVVVFVDEKSQCDWNAVAKELLDVLGKRFKLQIQPGRMVSLSGTQYWGNGHRQVGDFQSDIHTGASISTVSEPSKTSTIGIFVDVEVDTTSTSALGLSPGINKCILTCHHSIAPAPGKSDFQAALNTDFPLLGDTSSNPDIVYPAATVLKDSIRILESDIAADKKQLEEYHLAQESKANLSAWKTVIHDEESLLRRCEALQGNKPIGRVILSSGVRAFNPLGCNLETADLRVASPCTESHDHHLQDFALVKLTNRSFFWNATPMPTKNLLLADNRQFPVLRTKTPATNSRVFKYGCRTGFTAGTIIDHTFVNRLEDVSVHPGAPQERTYYRAWSIVGEGSAPFSAPGDSSSGVTDASSALVGQLHSGFDNGCDIAVSYMSAIDSVLEDIQSMIPGSTARLSPPRPSAAAFLSGYIRSIFEGACQAFAEKKPNFDAC